LNRAIRRALGSVAQLMVRSRRCTRQRWTGDGILMRKLPLVAAALGALAAPALGADDPIAVRQALMDANGGAAAVAGAIMKEEIAYEPVVGKAVILAFSASAHTFGDFFPEGSDDAARSDAAPAIWQDGAGFEAELETFETAVAAAVEASGRNGPADKAAFATAVQPIMKSCGSCHETYRVKD
jgi:cytochrome c556